MDIEETDFVCACRVIGAGCIYGITGVTQIDEIDTFDDAAIGNIKARNDAFC
jgi:hypothetical protein